jgi:hypothetical protein
MKLDSILLVVSQSLPSSPNWRPTWTNHDLLISCIHGGLQVSCIPCLYGKCQASDAVPCVPSWKDASKRFLHLRLPVKGRTLRLCCKFICAVSVILLLLSNDKMFQSSQRHSEFVEAMGASFGGEYADYVQHSNSTSRDLRRYYGNNSRRIQLIKWVRDPHNLFRHYLPYTMPRSLPLKVDWYCWIRV